MKNTTIVSTTLGLALVGLSSCAPTGFTSIAKDAPNGKTDTPIRESCVVDTTDYNLSPNVYSFAMTDDTGVNFGFSKGGGLIGAIGLGVRIKSGQLDLSMDIQKPLEPSIHQTALGKSKLTNSDFNFNIDISVIKVGLGNQSQTSVSKLTSKGFEDLLKNTASLISRDPNPWSTHITQVLDTNHFKMPVGSLGGVQYGDKFNVYKYEYVYNDSSVGCASGANGGYKKTGKVIATLVPLSIASGSTILVPVATPTEAITASDLVEIGELYKAKKSDKRSLKKAVRLAKASQSGRIVVEGVGEIDLTSYLNIQMGGMMNDSAFWLVGN